MKNMFKLAAVAVSMALVMSLAACSSGDDDVVDASTPKYLVTEQINKYVASIKYNQNVSDDEIKSLKETHEDTMSIASHCADCLDVYFKYLKSKLSYWTGDDPAEMGLVEIENAKKSLKNVKSYYATKEVFHEACVYKPGIKDALIDLVWFGFGEDGYYVSLSSEVRDDVEKIGDPLVSNENRIVDGKLNERQAASMKAYTDAAAALKAALNDDGKKTCETIIKAADDAIEAFGKLENKNVTKAEIEKVIKAVDGMCKDIQTKVYYELTTKESKPSKI